MTNLQDLPARLESARIRIARQALAARIAAAVVAAGAGAAWLAGPVTWVGAAAAGLFVTVFALAARITADDDAVDAEWLPLAVAAMPTDAGRAIRAELDRVTELAAQQRRLIITAAIGAAIGITGDLITM